MSTTNFSRPISQLPSRSSSGFIPLPPPPQPSYARRPSRSESHTSLLGRVLEDDTDVSCCVTTSRRSPCPSSGSATMSRASTLEDLGEWVVDIMAVQGGRTRWLERERVILILGGEYTLKFSISYELISQMFLPVLWNPSLPIPHSPIPLSSPNLLLNLDHLTPPSTLYLTLTLKMLHTKQRPYQ